MSVADFECRRSDQQHGEPAQLPSQNGGLQQMRPVVLQQPAEHGSPQVPPPLLLEPLPELLELVVAAPSGQLETTTP